MSEPQPGAGLKIDLGCGGAKRDGFIGIDTSPAPGVDHVVDLTSERFPFPDDSVDHIFSSHFLEHIAAPNHVFQEIARVCRDGARIEIWTPYAFSNDAFLYGHVTHFTEQQWLYYCYHEPDRDYHLGILKGRWLLHNIHYVVPHAIEADLLAHNVEVDFAIRFYKSVVQEFCVEIEFRRDLSVRPVVPNRSYSNERYGQRRVLPPLSKTPPWGLAET